MLANPTIAFVRILGEDRHDVNVADYNVGLRYLGGVAAEAGARPTIFDPFDLERASVDALASFDAAGFTVHHLNVEATLSACAELKRRAPHVFIVLGGHHAAATADEILADCPFIDSVCCGEGEDVVARTIVALARGEADAMRGRQMPRQYADIHELPFPSPPEDDIARISTSRGCPFDCSFCTTPGMRKLTGEPLYRSRDASHIVAEMRALAMHGVTRIRINDDLYITRNQRSHERALAVADGLRAAGCTINYKAEFRVDSFGPGDGAKLRLLQNSGLREVFLGVESGSERILAEYNKRITVAQIKEMLALFDDAGIVVNAGNILASPDATVDDICASIDVFEDVGLAYLFFRRVTFRAHVFPGTELERRLDSSGRLVKRPRYLPRDYVFLDPEIETTTSLFESVMPRFLEDVGGALFSTRKALLERSYDGLATRAHFQPLLDELNHLSATLLRRWFRAGGRQEGKRFEREFADYVGSVERIRDGLIAVHQNGAMPQAVAG